MWIVDGVAILQSVVKVMQCVEVGIALISQLCGAMWGLEPIAMALIIELVIMQRTELCCGAKWVGVLFVNEGIHNSAWEGVWGVRKAL